MRSFMYFLEHRIKQPIARSLMHLGISPDVLTISGVFITLLAGIVLVITREPWIAGLVYLVGVLTDFFDGALARLQENRDFRFGAWLDTICDRSSETIISGAIIVGYFTTIETQRVAFFAFAAGFLLAFCKAAAGEKGLHVDWAGREVFGYAGRVTILVIGMLATIVIPTALYYAMWVLLVFNVLVLIHRVSRVMETQTPRIALATE